jgi:hypothetical protein
MHPLGRDGHAHQVAGNLPVAASQFAAGHGRAALALRLRADSCVYPQPPRPTPMAEVAGPQLSPVRAPTNAAALATCGWISNNPAAGG